METRVFWKPSFWIWEICFRGATLEKSQWMSFLDPGEQYQHKAMSWFLHRTTDDDDDDDDDGGDGGGGGGDDDDDDDDYNDSDGNGGIMIR